MEIGEFRVPSVNGGGSTDDIENIHRKYEETAKKEKEESDKKEAENSENNVKEDSGKEE